MIKLASWVQKVPGLRELPRLWGYHDDAVLLQTIAGVTFRNPIGLSAGLDKEVELVPLMRSVGMGFMIAGSVTAESCEGNTRPWYQRLPKLQSLVVHAGLPSSGVKVARERIRAYPDKLFRKFPLSISVAKTNCAATASDKQGIADYTKTLRALKNEAHISLFEINISCPNAFGGESFTTPDRLEELLAAVDDMKVKKPVFIKMPIDLDWSAFRSLLEVIAKHDITGVTIGNLRKNREGLGIPADAQKGGLSGMPTRELCNELIRQTYRAYGDKLIIIGVGGVFSAEDAYEKIGAGATLVAMITGLIYEGPQVVGDINYNLKKLLERDGFDSISQAVGHDA